MLGVLSESRTNQGTRSLRLQRMECPPGSCLVFVKQLGKSRSCSARRLGWVWVQLVGLAGMLQQSV